MIGDREWVLGKDFNRCYRRPGFHQTVSRRSGLEDEIWSDRDRGVSIRVATAESAWERGSSRLLSWDWTIYNGPTALSLPPLFTDDLLLCFVMQGSPPPDLSPDAVFLEQTYDTGERICVHLPCINVNHLFQMSTGPGGTSTRNSGG